MSYNSLLAASKRHWPLALKLLERLQQVDLVADRVSFNSFLAAVAWRHQWQLLRRMRSATLRPDGYSYRACAEKAETWTAPRAHRHGDIESESLKKVLKVADLRPNCPKCLSFDVFKAFFEVSLEFLVANPFVTSAVCSSCPWEISLQLLLADTVVWLGRSRHLSQTQNC